MSEITQKKLVEQTVDDLQTGCEFLYKACKSHVDTATPKILSDKDYATIMKAVVKICSIARKTSFIATEY